MSGIDPMVQARKQQALALFQGGRLPEARGLLAELCESGSADAETWYYLGIVNGRLGYVDQVESCLRQALGLDPGFHEAALRLGETLAYLGRFGDAIEVFGRLCAALPQVADVWLKLGQAQEAAGQHAEALVSYQRSAVIAPASAAAHASLGNLRYFLGHCDEAIADYGRAVAADPMSPKAMLGFHLSLPPVYRDAEHLRQSRQRFREGLEEILACSAGFRERPGLIDELQWSNGFYLAYQGLDDRDLQTRFGDFFTDMARATLPQFFQEIPRRAAGGRRLRIGYASHFFHHHTVSYYFNGWIRHADRDRFETFVYHINPIIDEESQRLAASCDQYRPVTGSIAAIANIIRSDQLDVLVYPAIGMYPKEMWLAALRLAPVQCAAWGHPVTTGLPNVDYFLSADAMEPVGGEANYREELVRLDGIGVYCERPSLARDATRAQLSLPEDRRLYLCPQSLFKIHVDTDDLLTGIAARDPRALILFFEDYKPPVNDSFRQRLRRSFAAHGLDADASLRFLPRMGHADYLCVNRLADVMLDTPHWSGGRTSLDAFAAGLPVVTLPGEFSRGRQTYGMLREMDMGELIARGNEDYVSRAVSIASDHSLRDALSARIMEWAPGRIFGQRGTVRSLEEFLQSASGN
ncbi:MAG: tetratricopeptide repeat protein [Gammaproteobacteria bacterium]|nr:tetratricopeptide repeat protein [Gammaproteobacteria bacterium]